MQVYFDGGAAPSNPGPMHVGLVVVGGDKHFQTLGHGTNNLAEWVALIWAMEMARAAGASEVELIGDSELIVKQANGLYRVKAAEFRPFKAEFDRLKDLFRRVEVRYVPRSRNLAGKHIEAMLKLR